MALDINVALSVCPVVTLVKVMEAEAACGIPSLIIFCNVKPASVLW